MSKKIIFQDSFLVLGIMCLDKCGNSISEAITEYLNSLKKQNIVPEDAELLLDAEPQSLGIHRIYIAVKSEEQEPLITPSFHSCIEDLGFEILTDFNRTEPKKQKRHFTLNIIFNALAVFLILVGSFVFPPSLSLNIVFTALSFVTSAFTARFYLKNFWREFRQKNLSHMAVPVTLGWALALIHALYHVVTMPMMLNFSMVFMNFLMPLLLISIINGMDKIKDYLLNQSKAMTLCGLESLFPNMEANYECYQLDEHSVEILTQYGTTPLDSETGIQQIEDQISLLIKGPVQRQSKRTLTPGAIIKIKSGDCFPVDCIILSGKTDINAAHLTGESQQSTRCLDAVPAGAINLGTEVTVLATANPYNSTVNRLLFRANRELHPHAEVKKSRFRFFYSALIVACLAVAGVAPLIAGIFSLPIILENLTGILFSICPCTLVIANQLPTLLSIYQRNQRGILLNHPHLTEQTHDSKVIVFDKTGTLTTGNSMVSHAEGISDELWYKIYLLEKHHGQGHPLAKALVKHVEMHIRKHSLIQDIRDVKRDKANRGLSALVQGKKLHVGNLHYFKEEGIAIEERHFAKQDFNASLGYTPIYIAQDNQFCGTIYVKHEIRAGIPSTLLRLKQEGKKLLMLTGDSLKAAHGFNARIGNIFAREDIYAQQTPEDKEDFLKRLLKNPKGDPTGVWFIGDGLNDAPCAKIVSEQGGTSCAMMNTDLAAFFTDMSLNGSLDYVSAHPQLNRHLKKNIWQNHALLLYHLFSAFILLITFTASSLPVSPLLLMLSMSASTLFVLLNSYRLQIQSEMTLQKNTSILKKTFASDFTYGLLLSANTLAFSSVLITVLNTGSFTLQALLFTGGTLGILASGCFMSAIVLFVAYALLHGVFLLKSKSNDPYPDATDTHSMPQKTNLLLSQSSLKNNLYSLQKTETLLNAKKLTTETLEETQTFSLS